MEEKKTIISLSLDTELSYPIHDNSNLDEKTKIYISFIWAISKELYFYNVLSS